MIDLEDLLTKLILDHPTPTGKDQTSHRCPKCNTKLSRYNPGPYCYAHTPGMPVIRHSPVTLCASGDLEETNRYRFHYKKSISDDYEFGFTKDFDGFVDFDGKVCSIFDLMADDDLETEE